MAIKVQFVKSKNDNNETEIIAVFPDIVLEHNFHDGKLLKCFSNDNGYNECHSLWYKSAPIAKEKEYKKLFNQLINENNEIYEIINKKYKW